MRPSHGGTGGTDGGSRRAPDDETSSCRRGTGRPVLPRGHRPANHRKPPQNRTVVTEAQAADDATDAVLGEAELRRDVLTAQPGPHETGDLDPAAPGKPDPPS